VLVVLRPGLHHLGALSRASGATPSYGRTTYRDTTREVVTMPRRDPGPSVKDKELYESLRDEGNSKEKSARIANAAAASSRSEVGAKGGSSPAYEEWSVAELRQRAREVGIEGRSTMRKGELISALRNH
jgi:hypothetical protein